MPKLSPKSIARCSDLDLSPGHQTLHPATSPLGRTAGVLVGRVPPARSRTTRPAGGHRELPEIGPAVDGRDELGGVKFHLRKCWAYVTSNLFVPFFFWEVFVGV